MSGWYGVDLDGTLAYYDGWKGAATIGSPVPAMVERVKAWLAAGKEVRIFTARVSHDGTVERLAEANAAREAIAAWSKQHLGASLEVTNVKDFGMVELWDDRCVQVIANTGIPIGDQRRVQ